MKIKFYLTLILCVFICSQVILSQELNYPIETINGKEYYQYKVQSGDGLYAISKKFGVTQSEINSLNPQIYGGLKAGQVILIPKKSIVVKKAVSKPVIQDIEYISHKVERRQTLFAISRIYDVTQEAIVEANPILKERGLQSGDVLQIPVKKGTKEAQAKVEKAAKEEKAKSQIIKAETINAETVKKEAVKEEEKPKEKPKFQIFPKRKEATPEQAKPKETVKVAEQTPHVEVDGDFITHEVQAKETLYAISRKYNVTIDEIKDTNPVLKERGLQTGDVLQIPVKKDTKVAQAKAEDPVKEEEKTKEKPKIQIFSKIKEAVSKIGKSKETAKAEETPQFSSDGKYILHKVKPRETFYAISRKYDVTVDEIKAANPEITDVLKSGTVLRIPNKDYTGKAKPVEAPKIVEKSTYKVAYLLPFMLNNSTKDATIDKFLEFYMGSLLAINNAKNGDVNFEITTFDIEKSETKVHDIINKQELQKMDLIIGPAYTSQIPILADFAKRHKIYTVIPFSSKVAHIEDNPYVFQFNPDQDIQVNFLANALKTKFSNSNIVFVETGNAPVADDGFDVLNVLTKQLERTSYKKITGTDMRQIENYLSESSRNIIIFDNDNFKQVESYLSLLYDMSSKFDVGVIGQYSWRGLSGKKPKMYYISPFKGNMKATVYYETEFNKYYGNLHVTTNPRFDLLGYDLTTYFLSTMKKNGFTFNNSSSSLRFNNGVQSDFNFQRVGNRGGFINQNLYLIEDEAKSK